MSIQCIHERFAKVGEVLSQSLLHGHKRQLQSFHHCHFAFDQCHVDCVFFSINVDKCHLISTMSNSTFQYQFENDKMHGKHDCFRTNQWSRYTLAFKVNLSMKVWWSIGFCKLSCAMPASIPQPNDDMARQCNYCRWNSWSWNFHMIEFSSHLLFDSQEMLKKQFTSTVGVLGVFVLSHGEILHHQCASCLLILQFILPSKQAEGPHHHREEE